jgi:hypothetical protein
MMVEKDGEGEGPMYVGGRRCCCQDDPGVRSGLSIADAAP